MRLTADTFQWPLTELKLEDGAALTAYPDQFDDAQPTAANDDGLAPPGESEKWFGRNCNDGAALAPGATIARTAMPMPAVLKAIASRAGATHRRSNRRCPPHCALYGRPRTKPKETRAVGCTQGFTPESPRASRTSTNEMMAPPPRRWPGPRPSQPSAA